MQNAVEAVEAFVNDGEEFGDPVATESGRPSSSCPGQCQRQSCSQGLVLCIQSWQTYLYHWQKYPCILVFNLTLMIDVVDVYVLIALRVANNLKLVKKLRKIIIAKFKTLYIYFNLVLILVD